MNRPDWRKDKDYAGFDEKFPDTGWAWEFLRRNPKYVKDWILFNEEAKIYNGKYGPQWPKHSSTLRYHPPLFPNETERQWTKRCLENDADFERMTLERSYAKKWGLGKKLFDPDKTYKMIKKKIRFSDPLLYPRSVDALSELTPFFEDPDDPFNVVDPEFIVLAFSLKISIENQIDIAQKLLVKKKHIKLDKGHRDRSSWQLYLRVLDARSPPDKTSFKDIGVTLKIASGDEYPDNKATNRTRACHKRAKKIMPNHMKILLPDKRRKTTKKPSSKR